MTPDRSSSIRKTISLALVGFAAVALSNASLAATAEIKVNISLPQVLTTSLSQDSIQPASFDSRNVRQHFRDSKANGQLVRAQDSEIDGRPVTFLYIQT